MPKVKVNDIQIYYETKGKGFPLVMIKRFCSINYRKCTSRTTSCQ
jgi:hypothetical protein